MAQSTNGIKLYWATESSAASFPSTGFAEIGDITDIPAYDAVPVGLDWTPISETEAHRYLPGLKDGGDTWTLEMNMTEDGVEAWNDLADDAATAFAAGKQTWFAVVVPGWANALYMAGIPAKILWPGAGVDEVFRGDVSITVTDASKGWATKFS